MTNADREKASDDVRTRLERCTLPVRKRVSRAADCKKTYRRLTLRRQIGFQIRPIGEAPQYHAARIAAQNLELRRIAVAPEDFIATLVPAESASAQPAAEARVTLGAKVPAEIATQVRKLAGRRGVSGSTLITSALTEYLANV
jgi:hypothetical protein